MATAAQIGLRLGLKSIDRLQTRFVTAAWRTFVLFEDLIISRVK